MAGLSARGWPCDKEVCLEVRARTTGGRAAHGTQQRHCSWEGLAATGLTRAIGNSSEVIGNH
jgi:hypothetical protein